MMTEKHTDDRHYATAPFTGKAGKAAELKLAEKAAAEKAKNDK